MNARWRCWILTLVISLCGCSKDELPMVRGHMDPLPEELLEAPVRLECGATIVERHDGVNSISHVNNLCSIVQNNYRSFVQERGFEPTHENPLRWRVSLLKPGNCYRCMDDLEYRFYERAQEPMRGYTSVGYGMTFIDQTNDIEFDVTFVHELFHAHSLYYGTWKQETDEELAEEFTEALGFGY